MNISGMIFDLARFSLHDGPGIRSVIFMKGCPLHCIWCHNPESISAHPEILFAREKCINCRACSQICPQNAHTLSPDRHELNRNLCLACGKCASGCFAGALTLAGKRRSAASILEEAAKDADYYGKTGGITLSGGEPLAQPDFSAALLDGARKRSWTTAVETCGMAHRQIIEQLLPLTDFWLFDIKAIDPLKHQKFTGRSNEIILENLRFLDARNANIELHCPLIPGLNDSNDDLLAIRSLADSLRRKPEIIIKPFHPFGRGKLLQLDTMPLENAPIPEERDILRWKKLLRI